MNIWPSISIGWGVLQPCVYQFQDYLSAFSSYRIIVVYGNYLYLMAKVLMRVLSPHLFVLSILFTTSLKSISWYEELIISSSLGPCRLIQVVSLEVKFSIRESLRSLEATIMALGQSFLVPLP